MASIIGPTTESAVETPATPAAAAGRSGVVAVGRGGVVGVTASPRSPEVTAPTSGPLAVLSAAAMGQGH
jgi:hypothetical protein